MGHSRRDGGRSLIQVEDWQGTFGVLIVLTCAALLQGVLGGSGLRAEQKLFRPFRPLPVRVLGTHGTQPRKSPA